MKDRPLTATIEDDELVIRIGAGTLAYADHFRQWISYTVNHLVTDEVEFLKDVLAALTHEEEDGSSPLNDFLDAGIDAALDDGCTSVEGASGRWMLRLNGQPHGALHKTDERAYAAMAKLVLRRPDMADQIEVVPVIKSTDSDAQLVLEGV